MIELLKNIGLKLSVGGENFVVFKCFELMFDSLKEWCYLCGCVGNVWIFFFLNFIVYLVEEIW